MVNDPPGRYSPGRSEPSRPSHEEALLQFFRERPVHSVAVNPIAEYLDMTEDEVREGLGVLVERGLVVERYQLSVKGLREPGEK